MASSGRLQFLHYLSHRLLFLAQAWLGKAAQAEFQAGCGVKSYDGSHYSNSILSGCILLASITLQPAMVTRLMSGAGVLRKCAGNSAFHSATILVYVSG